MHLSSLHTHGFTRPRAGVLLQLGSTLLLAATALVATAAPKSAPATTTYTYAKVGDPRQATVVSPPSTPSFVLKGGGPDVDQAFRWMIERAGIKPGTGGRFVVIRATGTDAYNPYIYYSNAANSTTQPTAEDWVGGAALGLSSVETLVIPSREAADSTFVNEVVGKAHAVFIAGGDQSDYIRYWKGSKLDETLRTLMTGNVPVGGTSAGLAVLGQFDYTGANGSVTSAQALGDPYHRYVTLDPVDPSAALKLTGGFLAPAPLANMIFDSHLDTRDRMGRLIAFMSRTVAQSQSNTATVGCAGGVIPAGSARAIGISVETALLVEGPPGAVKARRITNPSNTTTESAAYFLRPLNSPTTCASRKPLTVTNVEIRKLARFNADAVFDLSDWMGIDGRFVDAIAGKLTTSPY